MQLTKINKDHQRSLEPNDTSCRIFQNNGVAVRNVEVAEDQSIMVLCVLRVRERHGASGERQVLFSFLFLSKSCFGPFFSLQMSDSLNMLNIS